MFVTISIFYYNGNYKQITYKWGMMNMKQKIRTLIILTTFVSLTIHIINKLLIAMSTAKGLLIKSDNQYYEWRFGKIRYTKKGSGTPILLIHDLDCGSSAYEFHKLANELSKTNEVYSIDLLGYGLSDKPNLTFTNFMYVELINDFIKNIINRKCDVITSGNSSSIAIMTCHNNPEAINQLIFINPQSLFEINKIPSNQTKLLKILFETPLIGTFIYNLLTTKFSFKKTFSTQYFYDRTLISELDIQNYVESSHTHGANSKYSFASYISKYTNINILHALKEINNSIYIISGDELEDSDITIENYIYYNNAIEYANIHKTKKLPHLERTHDVLTHIQTWIHS